MNISPIHPDDAAPVASEHATSTLGSRRTLGFRKYARRTFGVRKYGSRRTLGGRKYASRRTLMPRVKM